MRNAPRPRELGKLPRYVQRSAWTERQQSAISPPPRVVLAGVRPFDNLTSARRAGDHRRGATRTGQSCGRLVNSSYSRGKLPPARWHVRRGAILTI